MYLSVTCHLHLRQNGRDLLRATAVTRGWDRYQNESQHRKLTVEKKIPPQGIEPAIFRSRARRCTTELSPLPKYIFQRKLLPGPRTVMPQTRYNSTDPGGKKPCCNNRIPHCVTTAGKQFRTRRDAKPALFFLFLNLFLRQAN